MQLVSLKSKPTYGTKGAKMVVNKKTVGKLYWTYTPETKTLTVDYISVSAKERKKGYAKAAVKALIKDHPMATRVKTTTIRKTNKGSIALFKGLGFTMDKTKGGQWVGVLKPQPTKIEPDRDLLLRLFVATHFHTLINSAPEKFKSKKDWVNDTLEPACLSFAGKAVDLFAAPPQFKSRDELFHFHFHAIKLALEKWKKNGLLKQNAKILDKIYYVAYEYATLHPFDKGPIPYRNAWGKAQVLIKKIH